MSCPFWSDLPRDEENCSNAGASKRYHHVMDDSLGSISRHIQDFNLRACTNIKGYWQAPHEFRNDESRLHPKQHEFKNVLVVSYHRFS